MKTDEHREGLPEALPIPKSRAPYAIDELDGALRFVDVYGPYVRYSELDGWVAWNGLRWDRQHGEHGVKLMVRAMVRAWAEEIDARKDLKDDAKVSMTTRVKGLLSGSKLKNLLGHVRTHFDVATPGGYFDADATLLGAEGAVVELTADGVKQRRMIPEDRVTMKTGARLNPDAKHKMWDAYLDLFVPDHGTRQALKEAAGRLLLGGNRERLFVVLMGRSTSGKSLFLKLVDRALGEYAGPGDLTMFRGNIDERPRVDLVRAMPKRLVHTTEASEAWTLHADMVKRIAGADSISARLNHGNDMYEGVPHFTFWLATNNVPRIAGMDQATLRRIVVFPFNQTPAREDTSIGDKMLNDPEVIEAVLAWMAEGYDDFVARGEVMRDSREMAVAKAKFADQAGPAGDFLATCCEVTGNPNDGLLTTGLYKMYQFFCKENGIRNRDLMALNQFALALEETETLERNSAEGAHKVSTVRGLTFKTEWVNRLKSSPDAPDESMCAPLGPKPKPRARRARKA